MSGLILSQPLQDEQGAHPSQDRHSMLRVRDKTRIATRPARSRLFPKAISSEPECINNSGNIIAANTAGGTKRRLRSSQAGNSLPDKAIKDSRSK